MKPAKWTPEVRQAPEPGERVTVVIILDDGTELVSEGTFESADWNTEWDEVPGVPWDPQREYVKGETSLTLRLRRVDTTRVAPKIPVSIPREIE